MGMCDGYGVRRYYKHRIPNSKEIFLVIPSIGVGVSVEYLGVNINLGHAEIDYNDKNQNIIDGFFVQLGFDMYIAGWKKHIF